VTRETCPTCEETADSAILSPRAAKWRRTVEALLREVPLHGQQRSSADAVCREMEARAGKYDQSQGQKLAQLIEAGQSPELAKRLGPLDQMFDDCKTRRSAWPPPIRGRPRQLQEGQGKDKSNRGTAVETVNRGAPMKTKIQPACS